MSGQGNESRMTSQQETEPKPLPTDLVDKIREAARRLWLFVNSEYQEGDGTKMDSVANFCPGSAWVMLTGRASGIAR